MAILLIGDPHFKINNADETAIFVKETIEYIEKNTEKISFIVVLGDVLDTHEKIHLQPFYRATDFIIKLSSYKKTYVLIGNHDRINNTVFLTDEHPFIGLDGKNIIIVDKVLKDDDYIFVPYVPNGRFQEALDTIEYDETNIKAIFAHQEFYGVSMKSHISETGDKWSADKPPVFTGHIHQFQKLQENIIYVGTPYQNNFGDSTDKALMLLYINDGKNFTYERIFLNFIQKKTIFISAKELLTLELDFKHKWRIIIEDDIAVYKKYTAYPQVEKIIKNSNVKLEFRNKKLDIKDINKKEFHSTFHSILQKNLSKCDNELKTYFKEVIQSTSSKSLLLSSELKLL